MNLTENADHDEYGYSDYGIGFYPQSNFSINVEWSKKKFVSGVCNSLSVHTDKGKKDILLIDEGKIDGLDNTAITAEARYFVNITRSRKKLLAYNATDFCMLKL